MNDREHPQIPPHVTDDTSLSLLKQVRQADPLAWRRLVQLYSPLIFSWCQRCGLHQQEAGDILQEVFTSVIRHIGQFRREKADDTFRGWLRVITQNHIRMHFRKQGDHLQGVGGSSAQLRLQEIGEGTLDEHAEAGNSEYSGLLHRALEMLQSEFEEHTWQAFWQTTVDGTPGSEVAATLGMTPGAVRQAKYKVLRRLRSEFGELLD